MAFKKWPQWMASLANRWIILIEQYTIVEHQTNIRCEFFSWFITKNRKKNAFFYINIGNNIIEWIANCGIKEISFGMQQTLTACRLYAFGLLTDLLVFWLLSYMLGIAWYWQATKMATNQVDPNWIWLIGYCIWIWILF